MHQIFKLHTISIRNSLKKPTLIHLLKTAEDHSLAEDHFQAEDHPQAED